MRVKLGWLLAIALPAAALALGDGPQGRAAALASLCLVLWLGELVPPFLPTLLLWAGVPLLLAREGADRELRQTLAGAADPVLALFLGGFVLGRAAERHGIARWMASTSMKLAAGRRLQLLALTMMATAALSMWMSNIAAAAVMLNALRPFWDGKPLDDPYRRALLVGVAMAANLGGMATPIGSGPNALAVAAAHALRPVSFVQWMAFALPLTIGLLGLAYLVIVASFGVRGRIVATELPSTPPDARTWGVVAVFTAAVVAWLTEPLHHVPAAVVALLAAALLFATALLEGSDLARIDWSTLLLIAGGISLGRMLESSGLVRAAAGSLDLAAMPPRLTMVLAVSAAALLSALMSNTATATMLIPLALSIVPDASTPTLVALGCSLGAPFVISTPPNAMAYGEGGLTTKDLLVPGLVLMVVGCLVVALTGPWVLARFGL